MKIAVSFILFGAALIFSNADCLLVNGGMQNAVGNRFNSLPTNSTPPILGPHAVPQNRWDPYFDETSPHNISALVGREAYLSCRVRNLGNKTVSWIRHRDVHILTVGSYTYTSDQRFQALHLPETDEWTLQIKWAQERDAGLYECQISTQPVKSYFVQLNILEALAGDEPPRKTENRTRKLNGPVPTARILGGPDLHVDKGSTINLTCSISFSPEPPAYLFWYHRDNVISFDSSRGGVSVITEKGDVTTSFLLIQNADIPDSGEYSCSPSNADIARIIVHVLNGERPAGLQTGSAGLSNSSLNILLLMTLSYIYTTVYFNLHVDMFIILR